MNNFNLLVSGPRFNEINSKTELWFVLLMCGDKYPIIFDLEFSGLIAASSTIDGKEIVLKIKDILKKNSNFFQFILKIVPIDFICDTDTKVIAQIVQQHYREYIDPKDSFRIELKRRNNDLIDRNIFIENIAKIIDNQVNLDFPDKIIRFEMLGNLCGVTFLKPDEIIRIKPRLG